MANIVLVEDDLMLSEIYQTRLTLSGHECKVAYDGLTGLNLIRTATPDLVLLDLMLPQLSGDNVLEQMRESDWGKDIKVIILTNISEAEAPLKLDSLKFERYIVKVNLGHDDLVKIVNATLGIPSSQSNE